MVQGLGLRFQGLGFRVLLRGMRFLNQRLVRNLHVAYGLKIGLSGEGVGLIGFSRFTRFIGFAGFMVFTTSPKARRAPCTP